MADKWGSLSERLEIKISRQDKRLLETVARRTGASSVAAFVREAIREKLDRIVGDVAGGQAGQ